MTTFKKSSSQEPLSQFQPNLAQSILGWRGFKFVQMKDQTLLQGEIITKITKIHWRNIKNLLLQNNWANFNQFWRKASLGEDSNEKTISYHKVNIFFFFLNQRYDIIDLNCFLRWAMWPMGLLFIIILPFFVTVKVYTYILTVTFLTQQLES